MYTLCTVTGGKELGFRDQIIELSTDSTLYTVYCTDVHIMYCCAVMALDLDFQKMNSLYFGISSCSFRHRRISDKITEHLSIFLSVCLELLYCMVGFKLLKDILSIKVD